MTEFERTLRREGRAYQGPDAFYALSHRDAGRVVCAYGRGTYDVRESEAFPDRESAIRWCLRDAGVSHE